MKSWIGLLAVSVFSVSAYAGPSAQKIYAALNFPTADDQQEVYQDYVINKKLLPGLECWERDYKDMLEESEYDCVFRADGRDDKSIYFAMTDVLEVKLKKSSDVPDGSFQKVAGGLVCTKMPTAIVEWVYSCLMN